MFYSLFVELCKQRGESVAHVCKMIGIFPTTAHDWRNGARPRNSTVKKIADYFGVDVSYFDEPTTTGIDEDLVMGFINEVQKKNALPEDEAKLLNLYRMLSKEEKVKAIQAVTQIVFDSISESL